MPDDIKYVCVTSLGCPKNTLDTEIIVASLIGNGFGLAASPDEADVCLVSTCAFIEDARQEAAEHIAEACEWKAADPDQRKIVVCGCLVQSPAREKFAEDFPSVDMWFGIDEAPNAGKHLKKLFRDKAPGKPVLIRRKQPSYIYSHTTPRLQITPPHYAYVKIADGCDNRCSYCMIPGIRGPLRSRDQSSIVKEAESLISQDVRELIVIAQDTTAFGMDRKNAENINTLLKALDKLNGQFWIRLLYTHPAHFNDDLADIIAGSIHIVPYVDMPVQHISDKILKAMNRHCSSGDIIRVLKKLRSSIPGICIRTTFIVGFPGETDDDFKQLYDFVGEREFDRLGVFTYSPESATPAAGFKDSASPALAAERAQRIMDLQSKISLKKNKLLVGRDFDVIIDEVDGEQSLGRTLMDAPEIDNTVIVFGDAGEPGTLCRTRISAASEYELKAEII